MSYLVLARKYRPQTLEEVVGQEHVVRTLKNAIAQNRIAHAYIFVGPRGTGKTSTARIMAKCLNAPGGPRVDFDPEAPVCKEIAEGRCLDVIEIDAASNRGIDQIRELRDGVAYAPTGGKFKVYIIDEVHMLTKEAFNALLKTLEEPPPHVKFFFATTEPDKVLPTILGRCQRFDLKPIPSALIVSHLKKICQLEGVTIEDRALEAIARGAEGGMRDAEGALDQLISFCDKNIVEDDVLRVFGLASRAQLTELSGAILMGDTGRALGCLEAVYESGKDLARVLADLLEHFRNLLLLKVAGAPPSELPETTVATLKSQVDCVDTETLLRIVEHFVSAESRIKFALSKKVFFEIAIIRAIRSRDMVSIDGVLKQLNALKDGSFAPAPASAARPVAASPAPAAPTLTPAASAPLTPAAPPKAPTAPAPVETITDFKTLWSRVAADVAKERPLIATFIAQGHAKSLTGTELVVAFAKQNAFHINSLNSPKNRDLINAKLAEYAGRTLVARFEIDESLPADAPTPAPAPAPVPTGGAAGDTAKPPFDYTPPPREASKKSLEDLKNDPLIKQALETFRARIVEVK